MTDIVEPYKRLAYVLQYIEAELLRQALVLMDKKADGQQFWVYLCIHDSIFIEMDLDDSPSVRKTIQGCFDHAMHRYFPKIPFRKFRDGWLSEQPDGAELIGRYYDTAPVIVI